MNDRILNILSMCLQAKGKGHDVFFSFRAHVNRFEVDSHEGGWKSPEKDEDGNCISGTDNLTRSFSSDTSDEKSIDEIEAYLKELIAS